MKKLEDIGFYTLEDERARNTSSTSPMWRCEMLIIGDCNFNCPYCRGFRNFSERCGKINTQIAESVLDTWIKDGLKNIRFSGGEPTLHEDLGHFVRICRDGGVERIAISTNGSADFEVYRKLVEDGVNDFSISLDACCASFADQMAGVEGHFGTVIENIKKISELTYVTVGVVLTEDNIEDVEIALSALSSLVTSTGDTIARELEGNFANMTVRTTGGLLLSTVIDSNPKVVLTAIVDENLETTIIHEMKRLQPIISNAIEGVAIEIKGRDKLKAPNQRKIITFFE